MKPESKKRGFTVIELLTVMSVIVILLSLLLPSLNMVRWYARYVTQKNQLKNIDTGLQAFEMDHGEYPDSGATDSTGANYCGAMKLCEALVGQDGLGFNPDSTFMADGQDAGGNELYPRPAPSTMTPAYEQNLRSRKEYLEPKDVLIGNLDNFYPSSGWANAGKIALLCDVYVRNNLRNDAGQKLGMPILYYKADPSKLYNDTNSANFSNNIYSYLDNQNFLDLGLPWDTGTKCQLYGPASTQGLTFYEKILDKSALPIQRPHNKESFILISAGRDNIYGTRDDVFNFPD
jgi:prepilin-type N-terminal cleavage/methylation domain-containing protein